MSTIDRYLCAVLTAALASGVLAGEAKRSGGQSPEDRAKAQRAAQQLVWGVARLQEDIIAELGGQKERALYRQADEVLGLLTHFKSALTSGAARARLYQEFNQLDLKLTALLRSVRALGKEQRALHRDAARLTAAAEELHFALSAGDTSEARTREVLRRQAHALVVAAGDLQQTVHYALSDSTDQGTLEEDLHRLMVATEQFQKSLTRGSDRSQLQSDFVHINNAWERVSAGLKRLTPRENNYLLRSATRVDHFHARLYRLLGVKGKRPQLTIRT